MKVLLINAPPLKELGITGEIYPPLGILYLAAYARKHIKDLQIKVLDGYKEDKRRILRKIINFNPELLGISFTTQSATGAYRLINEVKERKEGIKIVIGGPHPTILPEECFMKSKADIVVIGEGEITFLEILKNLEKGKETNSILGTVVSKNGEIKRNPLRPLIHNLDSIPFPARDLIDIKKYPGYMYKKRRYDTDIISSRGCPFNCVYCSNPIWKLQKPWYRLRSQKNVVDEIEHITKNYGIKEIFDQTDEFNGSKIWAKKLCDEIIRRGLDVSWKAQMRVDNVDEELAEKLKSSGFWLGLFGLESASDSTLEGIKKRQTINQVEKTLSLMKKYQIKCFGLFMTFNVWEKEGKLYSENKEGSLRTLEFAKKLLKERKISLFGWSMTTPYPGSKLYDIALKHGLIKKEYIGHWEFFDSGANFVMKLPDVSEKDWLEVLNAGKKLQAKLLFTSGTFSFSALFLYFKKAFFLIKRNLEELIKMKRMKGIE